jgi:hypothetical protein
MKFGPHTRFFDVEGIPVTVNAQCTPGMYCAAWDEAKPRRFSFESAERNGAPITEAKFLAMLPVTPSP